MKKVCGLILAFVFVSTSAFAESYEGVVKEISAARVENKIKVVLDTGAEFYALSNDSYYDAKILMMLQTSMIASKKVRVETTRKNLLESISVLAD